MTTRDDNPPGQHDDRPGTPASATDPAVTTARQPQSPSPGCLARHACIGTAPFIFTARDRDRDADGTPAVTEAFGGWQIPGPGHHGMLRTGTIQVPAGSPVAQAAHHAATHPALQAAIAAILSGNVTCCPCTPAAPCLALDATHLLLALCRATRDPATQRNAALTTNLDRPPADHRITVGCPLDCLAPHLSARALAPLRRELPALLRRPAAVGDVAGLCQRRQLRTIRNIGPRRAGEIELILTLAGLLTPPPDPQTRRPG